MAKEKPRPLTVDLYFVQQQYCVEGEPVTPERWNAMLPAYGSAHEARGFILEQRRIRSQSPIPNTDVHYRVVKVGLPFTMVE